MISYCLFAVMVIEVGITRSSPRIGPKILPVRLYSGTTFSRADAIRTDGTRGCERFFNLEQANTRGFRRPFSLDKGHSASYTVVYSEGKRWPKSLRRSPLDRKFMFSVRSQASLGRRSVHGPFPDLLPHATCAPSLSISPTESISTQYPKRLTENF